MLAETEGEIVAQYTMRHNDINCMGSRIIAGQSCDTMVRADKRDKKLFIRLAEESYARAANEGMKIVFGFPNRNSYPGFLRKLGWHKICALKHYYYRIGVQRLLGKRTDCIIKHFLQFPNRVRYVVEQKFLGGDMSIAVSPEITQEGVAVLEEALDYEVLSIWKDLDYMQWRYENHPEYTYDFHVISINGRPEGLAVSRECGETVAICELIHRTKNIRQSALLIRHLVAYYSKSAAQKIEFLGYDDGFFDAVFSSSGFNASLSSVFFAARVFGDEKIERMSVIQNNWTVSMGDSDVM
jgi:hypothetical protein